MKAENMYCDHCEIHTVQYWEKEGMRCADCHTVNKFCNISVKEFEEYMVDMIRSQKWRSVAEINHYFNRLTTKVKNDFRSRRNKEIVGVMTNVAQFMTGIKPDGEAEGWWSEWDESVLQSVVELIKTISFNPSPEG